jgi:hypothetical protein
MVKELFDATPDMWQEDVLRAFASQDADKVRILMKACAGPGKSTCLAWCAWNFLLCYAEKGNHPKGVAVSVSFDNLKTGLWSELSHWQKKSELLTECFVWTQTKIFEKNNPETWCLYARSFPQSADSTVIGKTLSGIHAKYILYIIDESGDIPSAIAKTAEQGLGETLQREGGFAKLMTAGNPISTDGLLYEASTSDNWFKVTITADPKDPKRTPRVSASWAQEQIDKYGSDDPWVMSYILGLFPTSSINTLLSLDQVEKAMSGHMDLSGYAYSQKRMGIDVAREGMDSTVIFPRQGLRAHNYVQMRNADGPTVAARVIMAKSKWGSEMEFIDSTGGFGSSVIDNMILNGHTPQGIHFSSKAVDERYFNKRAEMWLEMAEWVKRGGVLPKCERLKKELCAPTYSFKNGKLILEDKERIKKRLGFSPDIADALALTFAIKDMPASDEFEYIRKLNGGGGNKMKTEYNPLSR